MCHKLFYNIQSATEKCIFLQVYKKWAWKYKYTYTVKHSDSLLVGFFLPENTVPDWYENTSSSWKVIDKMNAFKEEVQHKDFLAKQTLTRFY